MLKAGEEMTFIRDTPIWESTDLSGNPALALSQDTQLDTLEARSITLRQSILAHNITLYRISLHGRDYWITPDLRIDNGKVILVYPRPGWNIVSPLMIFLLGVLAAVGYFRYDRTFSGTRLKIKRQYLLPLSLLLVHYAWISCLYALYPSTYQGVTDEGEYFRIAQHLLNLDISSTKFGYTIGYPLFCMPFFLVFSSDYDVVSQLISYFSALLMTPLSLVLAYYLIKKICESEVKAFAAVALCLIVPKFYFAVETPWMGNILSPFGLFHSRYIFQAYQFCFTGHNSLSEWVSVNLILGIFLLVLCWKGRDWKYIAIGAMFGLALLVRMNNLCFAPLVAYLFWISDKERLCVSRAILVRSVILAALTAGVVFSPQLAINFLHQGSIFKTPYTITYAGIGRSWLGLEFIANISSYYFKIHTISFVTGLVAMFFINKAITRNIIIFWVVPTLLFFFCFNFTGHPYRLFLPVFPALAAALTCSNIWNISIKPVKRWILAGLIVFMLTPVLPLNFDVFFAPLLGGTSWETSINILYRTKIIATVVLWLTGLYYFRKERQMFLFVLLLGLMICSWASWLMVLAAGILLIWAFVLFAQDVRHHIFQKRSVVDS
jgi:hypothetical protein